MILTLQNLQKLPSNLVVEIKRTTLPRYTDHSAQVLFIVCWTRITVCKTHVLFHKVIFWTLIVIYWNPAAF
jgi:hypothetical protein